MLWLALAACSPSSSSSDDEDDTTPSPPVPTTPAPSDTDTDTDTVDTDTDSPPPPVPLLDEALDVRCPNPFVGEPFPLGDDLHRATLTGATGRCNDGSQPVLMVRAATDVAHAADWLWIFDGGAFCTDYESCAARWCGEDPPFGSRHMSSRFYELTQGGEGITTQLPVNNYAGWNVVFAAYCSSDQWMGAGGEHVFEGDPDYRLYFEGALVAEDGISAGVAGIVSDDGLASMPSLADALNVVVMGVSAGCHGAAQSRNLIAASAPLAETTTVLDSTFYSPEEVTDPAVNAAFDTLHQDTWTQTAEPAWGAVVAPECAAQFPTELWRCLNIENAMSNGWIEGRILWHHDLKDPVIFPYYQAAGVTLPGFAQLGVDSFRFYEDDESLVSLHADNCALHTAIDGAHAFWGITVVDAVHGGAPQTLQDVMNAFIAGERPVVIDDATGTGSVCQ